MSDETSDQVTPREIIEQAVMQSMIKAKEHSTGDPVKDQLMDDILMSSAAVAKTIISARDFNPAMGNGFLLVGDAWKSICLAAVDMMSEAT